MYRISKNRKLSHRLQYLSTIQSTFPQGYQSCQDMHEIEEDIKHYQLMLKKYLYPNVSPKGVERNNTKFKNHQVHMHPIYNFFHRYYRYSISNLSKYSPGIHKSISSEVYLKFKESINGEFLVHDNNYYYDRDMFLSQLKPGGVYKSARIFVNRDILRRTVKKSPFFGCFGFHEWAMLYSGRQHDQPLKKHQETLPLRVSQATIDNVVETGPLRCTHFDAWRFFHPDAQPMNIISNMTRNTQIDYEQPGCVHANMDLFKYAYQLYPLVSSALLLKCLDVAITARKIDVRASPYDSSQFSECQNPICVETSEGRQQYVLEQTALYNSAKTVRQELLDVYEYVLSDNENFTI